MDFDMFNFNNSDLSQLPNKNYVKLFEKFEEIETLNVKEWKSNHVLGYFCKKYKQYYNMDYKFKFNTPAPSKCFEVFQIRRLGLILSSQPDFLKEYIDWVFINKIPKAKRRITSVSFLNTEDFINEYKTKYFTLEDKIDRSTELPEKYLEIFKEAGLNLSTYGDLAFLAMDKTKDNLFSKIEELGFDKSLLEKIV